MLTVFSSLFLSVRYLLFQPYYASKIIHVKKSTFFIPILKNLFAFLIILFAFIICNKIITVNSWPQFILEIAAAGLAGYMISAVILLQKEERTHLLQIMKSKIKR